MEAIQIKPSNDNITTQEDLSLHVPNMECGQITINDIDLFKRTLNSSINTLGVEELIKERDKFSKRSTMWDVLNSLKALALENRKRSMSEPLKVIEQRYLNGVLKGDLAVSVYSKAGKVLSQLIEKHYTVLKRSFAEYDDSYRQIVAETIIKKGDKYCLLKRNPGFTDDRLVGCTGLVGGHINVYDSSYEEGLKRELLEELSMSDDVHFDIKPLGFIKQMCTGVSNEHLCYLFITHLNSDEDINKSILESTSKGETLIELTEDEIRAELKLCDQSSLDSWARESFKILFR